MNAMTKGVGREVTLPKVVNPELRLSPETESKIKARYEGDEKTDLVEGPISKGVYAACGRLEDGTLIEMALIRERWRGIHFGAGAGPQKILVFVNGDLRAGPGINGDAMDLADYLRGRNWGDAQIPFYANNLTWASTAGEMLANVLGMERTHA